MVNPIKLLSPKVIELVTSVINKALNVPKRKINSEKIIPQVILRKSKAIIIIADTTETITLILYSADNLNFANK